MASICFTGSFKLELFKVWHIKSFFGLTAGLKEVTACVRNVLVNLRDASRWILSLFPVFYAELSLLTLGCKFTLAV